ncbi:MAG: aminoacyl-tRNA hydrolase [Kiritimatiellaeota bacterium]|nr:aminoacyl-tRNA hydrolase [Kiritimatiellota bacterium]
MKLIVGLGNPGRKYAQTRHNVGFAVLDELARRAGAVFRKPLFAKASTAKALVGGQDVLLVKPETFMNLSGAAVAALARKRGLPPQDVVVVLDDAELAMGRLRIRARGSAGGHNGLKSMVQCLGSEEFIRVRVGIGRSGGARALTDHVLGSFTAAERAALAPVIPLAAEAVEGILAAGVEQAMNRYNGERSA